MKRKAQGEVITTILIILLVLAAVVIAWQAIRGTVQKGAGAIEPKMTATLACMDVKVDVIEAKATGAATSNVKVTRLAGGNITVGDIRVLVDGAVQSTTATGAIAELETKTIGVPINVSEKKIEVAAILSGGTSCDIGDTMTAPKS